MCVCVCIKQRERERERVSERERERRTTPTHQHTHTHTYSGSLDTDSTPLLRLAQKGAAAQVDVPVGMPLSLGLFSLYTRSLLTLMHTYVGWQAYHYHHWNPFCRCFFFFFSLHSVDFKRFVGPKPKHTTKGTVE